jgi:aminopeptidase N
MAIVGRWIGVFLVLSVTSEARPSESDRHDVHSLSNADEVRVRHVALDLTVDFDRKVLRGTATLTVVRLPGSPLGAPLVLDTHGLVIEGAKAGSAEVSWALAKADPILGAPLTVGLPNGVDRVEIAYRTEPSAGALQWLDPPLTAGRKHPFLYTQSEAIRARTWVPLQDSPGVRITYNATIRVPSALQAVMSADRAPAGNEPNVFRFTMTQPIPSYLMALAVGDLAFRSLGPRTGVFAEPSVIADAAFEFADTEAMVQTIEKRYGPYRWGRYDLLVLPPSFPMGGMENPKLTFATPTVLAGDRSLVALIAHELAHSWSGNLVTNATWRDFWLNEGFTTYLERRVTEDLYGPERAEMEAVLGLAQLRNELKGMAPKDQILHINLDGRDPDEALTGVPYEKGALFLTTLEKAFGRERFDVFLRDYFDHFAFQSVTTNDFEHYLRTHLFVQDVPVAATIDLDAWLNRPDLPPGYFEAKSKRLEAVDRAAREWLDGKITAAQIPAKEWSTFEWLRFLHALPEKLSSEQMAELDAAFSLTERRNSEIASQWLLHAIRSGYHRADDRLEAFLTTVGRRKFLTPLYGALAQVDKDRARAIYEKARPHYHPFAVESLDKMLKSK